MQLVKLILMVISFMVANSLAQPDLDSWAEQTLSKLTETCDSTPRQKWVERYRDLSVEVMSQLEGVTYKKFRSYKAEGPLRQVVSNVFPQHLPEGKTKRGMHPCFADWVDFQNAKSVKVAQLALDRFETCSKARFRRGLPDALEGFIVCMRRLKD